MNRQSAIIEGPSRLIGVVGKTVVAVFFDIHVADYGYLYFEDGSTVGTHVGNPDVGIEIDVPRFFNGEREWSRYAVYPETDQVVHWFYQWLIEQKLDAIESGRGSESYRADKVLSLQAIVEQYCEWIGSNE